MNAQYWDPVTGSKNERFMMNANKIIKGVPMSVRDEVSKYDSL